MSAKEFLTILKSIETAYAIAKEIYLQNTVITFNDSTSKLLEILISLKENVLALQSNYSSFLKQTEDEKNEYIKAKIEMQTAKNKLKDAEIMMNEAIERAKAATKANELFANHLEHLWNEMKDKEKKTK